MKKLLKNKQIKLVMTAVALVCLTYMFLPQRGEDAVPVSQPALLQKQVTVAPEKVVEELPVQEPVIEEETPKSETEEISKSEPIDYPAGKTVDEAWKTLVLLWNNNPKNCNHGIYTEMGKFILKDLGNQDYFKQDPKIYVDKPYKIIQKGNYAVVDFQEPENEEHFPFFFCKTKEGWKFNVIHQRKLVRFGEQSYCGIEKYISPYLAITRKFPSYTGIDLPVGEKDFYQLSDDLKLFEELQKLEKLYKSGNMTFEEALELAKLYSKVSLDAKAVPILEKTMKALPENPAVYKYMAISHVNHNYNYKSAKKMIKKYLKLVPDSEFGHNFLAYLRINDGQYGKAEAEFEKVLKLQPENCYASSNLAQIYGRTWEKLSDKNEEKALYRQKYDETFKKASTCCRGRDYERFIWLVQWKHSR